MSKRNPAASVRQRLLNKSKVQGRPFQEILQYFAMERFLYRLAQSSSADAFVLKGALLLTAWQAPVSRPTMDIDLAGRTDNSLENISTVIRSLCGIESTEDGMTFNGDSVEASRIKEDADYEGVRVRFDAELARARIRMQIDLGFGDTILPAPKRLQYPTILDLPAPVLLAYPRESVVAEKLEALTVLGLINSRLKDYFDLWLLSKLYPFDGPVLAAAVEATFQRRGTRIQAVPVGLTETFGRDQFRAVQWRALRRQSGFATAPQELSHLVRAVSAFVSPLLSALAQRAEFLAHWHPGGPWL